MVIRILDVTVCPMVFSALFDKYFALFLLVWGVCGFWVAKRF